MNEPLTDSLSPSERLRAQAVDAYEHWPLRMAGISPAAFDGEYANRVAEELATFMVGYVHGRAEEVFRTGSVAVLEDARKRLVEDICDLTDITRERALSWVLTFEAAVREDALIAAVRDEFRPDAALVEAARDVVEAKNRLTAYARSAQRTGRFDGELGHLTDALTAADNALAAALAAVDGLDSDSDHPHQGGATAPSGPSGQRKEVGDGR